MSEDKFVDESWKESASKEKEHLKDSNASQSGPSGKDSKIHVSEFERAKHEAAEKDTDPKQDAAEQPQQEQVSDIQINFLNYLSSLAFQTMIFLGEIDSPVTNKKEQNLDQAKFLIDTLTMLREKTKGNLNKQEEDFLNASIYELQMKYVEILQQEKKND